VHIGGHDVSALAPALRDVTFVFQQYSLYPHLSVFDNLAFPLRSPLRRTPEAEVQRKVTEVAKMLRIDDKLGNAATKLSGGQMQRVAIGRALVREPAITLMDEPLSSLDAKLRNDLRLELKRIQQDLGATLLYVTHDQIEALTLADRIAVMKDRVIQQLGTPREIFERPANRFVASFVGSPSMNFIAGRLRLDGGPTFTAGDFDLPLPDYPFAAAPREGEVELGIRPEHIETVAGGRTLPIEMVEPMGSDVLAWSRLGGTPVSLRLPAETAPRVGDQVAVAIPPAKVNLFDSSGQRL